MYSNILVKIIPSIIIIIISGYVLPWWSFTIITLIVGYSSYYQKIAIINGFVIGFLSWFILLMYSFYNGGYIIFTKISFIMKLNNPILLIIFSSSLSGILGLISGWTGWLFNKRENDD